MIDTLTYASWPDVAAHVRAALVRLGSRGFLVLGEPPSTAAEPGRRRRLSRPRLEPVRFVQALRLDDQLGLECVGAQRFGGEWPVDEATDDELRRLGWLGPGDARYEAMGGPLYRRWWPVGDPDGVAALLVSTLRALDVPPSPLVLRVDEQAVPVTR